MIRAILMAAIFSLWHFLVLSEVKLGKLDDLLQSSTIKTVSIYTNQTGIDELFESSLTKLLSNPKIKLVSVLTPEHGLKGNHYAKVRIEEEKPALPFKLISLFGKTDKPTKDKLEGVDLLVVDIQTIGLRFYTYLTTLLQLMAIASEANVKVWVIDRPNPINGLLVDGPMMEKKYFSRHGLAKIPYVHGMTLGELALYYKGEMNLKLQLAIIPMKGWRRSMNFRQTGLNWVPSSPNIPEEDTPIFTASTGALGELELVNIGVGYTLPFKIIGSPWIDAEDFSKALNGYQLPGVHFQPFHYKPFYGVYSGETCQGVLIMITDYSAYRPFSVQYALLSTLKMLYPKPFYEKIHGLAEDQLLQFDRIIGNDKVMQGMKNPRASSLMNFVERDEKLRKNFMHKRAKYLIKAYEG